MNPAWEPAKDPETTIPHTKTRRQTYGETHCYCKAREAKRDGDTQAHTFTQKRDRCIPLAFRQTNCLSEDNRASEVRTRSRPEIHLFKKGRCGRSQSEMGGSAEDIST